jgi:hypothetical protein
MPVDPILAAVADPLKDLAAAVTNLRQYLLDPKASVAEFRSRLTEVDKARAAIADRLDGRQGAPIADFFEAIGNGLVEAQKRLDRSSASYVKGALGAAAGPGGSSGSLALPTLFRIPKVSAELKFALEKSGSSGFNVVFYSQRSDVRELHQQTVNIELVSVPLPPDYLNQRGPAAATGAVTGAATLSAEDSDAAAATGSALGSGPLAFSAEAEPLPIAPPPPLLARLADAAGREQAYKLLGELAPLQKPRRQRRIEQLLHPAEWPRALIFTDPQQTFFILHAASDDSGELSLWQLVSRPAACSLLWRLRKSDAELSFTLERLRRFVASLADDQLQASRAV